MTWAPVAAGRCLSGQFCGRGAGRRGALIAVGAIGEATATSYLPVSSTGLGQFGEQASRASQFHAPGAGPLDQVAGSCS
jgi:hypothetical protein